MIKAIALLALLAAASHLTLAEPVRWLSYETALNEASNANKLVYVYFYSENCLPCRWMERVFEDPQVSRELNTAFLPVRVNVVERPDLASAYRVPATPAHLFICPNGTPLGGALGYRDAESFLGLLNRARIEAKKRCPTLREEGSVSGVGSGGSAPGIEAAVVFSLLIGLSTPLSPCIFPLLPVVYLIASKGGRRGPALFTLGLFSFSAAMGVLASGLFFAVRIHAEPLAYGLLLFAGLALLFDRLSSVLSHATSRVATKISGSVRKANPFVLGALTVVMWGPCAAPMAAAAFSLAAFARDSAEVAAVGLTFAAGLSLSVYMLTLIMKKMRVLAIRKRAYKRFNRILGALMVTAVMLRAFGLI